MPLTLFTHEKTPLTLRKYLEELGGAMVDDGENWKAIFAKGVLKKKKLVISYDEEWCSDPHWSEQLMGMANYVEDFDGDSERATLVYEMILALKASYAIQAEPDLPEDPTWLEVVLALAKEADGILFHPHALFDHRLKLILAADGEFDPQSHIPRFQRAEDILGWEDSEGSVLQPPVASRVVKRMYCLVALVARGMFEMNSLSDAKPAYSLADMINWIEHLGIRDEFEAEEWEVIQAPLGRLTPPQTLNAVWRIEGAVVLAWALHLTKLPAYDQVVDVDAFFAAVKFLHEKSLSYLQAPTLREAGELESYREQAFALHWRMVDFRVRPKKIDFQAMEKECWFGPLDLSWAVLKKGDLVLQGKLITKAKSDVLGTVSSIAKERHMAANWLVGNSKLYSETDVST